MRKTTTLFTLAAALLAAPAFAQPGTLDPTYGTAGITILQPGTLHDVGYAVVVLDDNTSLVTGVAKYNNINSIFVAHLDASGNLITTWGQAGGYSYITLGLESYGYGLKVNADGIYICGTTYITYAQAEVVLTKLHLDGSPDTTFGTAGVVHTAVGTTDADANSMALQSDGKIVVAGFTGSGSSANGLIMRYTSEGALDTTFNSTGIVNLSAYSGDDRLFGMDILDDGSIIGAGYATIAGDKKAMLVKVDTAGNLVNAFGGDGVLIPGFNATELDARAVKADGQQFYLTGIWMDVPSDWDTYIAKFNDDGSFDTSFGTGGTTVINSNPNEGGFGIALQTDGKVLVCGTTGQFGFLGPRYFQLDRFDTDGTADATFGTNGQTITQFGPTAFADAYGVAVQTDGKIIVTGFRSGANNDVVMARYEGDISTAVPEHAQDPETPTLYPNPSATGRVVLSLPDNSADATITVIDAQGRTVLAPMTVQHDASRIELPLNGIQAGSYLVRVQRANGTQVLPLVISE